MNKFEIIESIMNELNDEVKSELLVSYMVGEFDKKVFEINKNYKDENKKEFASRNIKNEFKDRLIKKVISIKSKKLYEESLVK